MTSCLQFLRKVKYNGWYILGAAIQFLFSLYDFMLTIKLSTSEKAFLGISTILL